MKKLIFLSLCLLSLSSLLEAGCGCSYGDDMSYDYVDGDYDYDYGYEGSYRRPFRSFRRY